MNTMTNLKYTVMTFERRGPSGMGPPAQGEWFYYEIGANNTITLQGYRAGTQTEVESAVGAIIERLNHDKPGTIPPAGAASRLIFPTSTTNEDEDGNVTEEEESAPPPEIDE